VTSKQNNSQLTYSSLTFRYGIRGQVT